jgi:hypothetical protein
VVLVSPSDSLRAELQARIANHCDAKEVPRPTFDTADHHWPPLWSTWLALPAAALSKGPTVEPTTQLPYAAAVFPKLTVLLDADVARRGANKLQWSTLVRQPGRGPTLRLQTMDARAIDEELLAAVDAIWPDLGPPSENRLK